MTQQELFVKALTFAGGELDGQKLTPIYSTQRLTKVLVAFARTLEDGGTKAEAQAQAPDFNSARKGLKY